MQGWMIALIIIACVVAVLAVAFLVGSLIAVHIILGRRKDPSEAKKAQSGNDANKFGVNTAWFDGVENVTDRLFITAYDGIKLGAMLIKQPEHHGRVAVCCHGYGATMRSMQVQAKLFYDRGFDVLLPSMRGHGISGGKVGMAWVDRFDVMRWVNKLIELYGSSVSIALCGMSMGGATVVSVAGMEPPPQVKCVIDDCGFSSQREEYAAQLHGLPVSLALLPLAVGVKLVHGYSIGDADITTLAKNMTVPALFIHGEADKFVPLALGQKLFDACASADKTFLSVPDAAHACAYVADKEKYTAAFNEFIDGHIAGSEFIFDSDELIQQQQKAQEPDNAAATEDDAKTEDGEQAANNNAPDVAEQSADGEAAQAPEGSAQ